MPKRLYNTDHQPLLINPVSGERAVMPGESRVFTDEELSAGLTGSWSEEDPRKGLEAEKKFKQRRDAKASKAKPSPSEAEPADDAEANPSPAESGETKE